MAIAKRTDSASTSDDKTSTTAPVSYVNPLAAGIGASGMDIARQNAKSCIEGYIMMQGSSMGRQHRAGYDERKYRLATEYLKDGTESELLTSEADIRGISVKDLATLIKGKGEEADKIEIWRIAIRFAIDKAETKGEILRILGDNNVPTTTLTM